MAARLILAAAAACSTDPEHGPGPGPIPSVSEVVIDSNPGRLTNETTAVFTFHADGATSFTCAVDGAVAPCTSPASFEVVDGMHTFAVGTGKHTDVTDDFATRHWAVDSMPPQTTIDGGPGAVDNSATETITFSSSEVATFECSLDVAPFAACVSPLSITPGDGPHTFAVRATDPAGNTDPTVAAVSWTLDTAIVDTTITSGPPNNGASAAAVSFGFTASVSPATFECAFDADNFAPCTSPAARTLGNGSHLFSVRATDALGLVDPTPATRAFAVDTIAPIVTITSHPGDPSNVTTPVFTFSVTESGTTRECRVDGAAFTPCSSPFTTAALADGPHQFSVRATDAVGNVSDVVTYGWTIDRDAPTVTITSGPSGPINTRTATFTFSTSGGNTTTCKLDGGTGACTSPFTTVALGDGPHQFSVSATDAAGNVGSDARVFSVDTTGPTVVFDSTPSALWPVPYFDFVFHGEPNATFECALDAAAFTACASPFTLTLTSYGPHSLHVRATDVLGNVGAAATASWQYSGTALVFAQFNGSSPENLSELADVPGYAPPASIASVTGVGGRSGLAARAPSYRYVGTKRALSTTPDHKMSAALWIRPLADAAGVVWSNATATDGITVSWINGGIRLSLLHGGSEDHVDTSLAVNEWHLVVVSSTAADGAELWIDATRRGVAGAGSGATGFDEHQAADLTIGPMTAIDIDDLLVAPGAASPTYICAALGGGHADPGSGTCTNLARPVYEMSFEGDFLDTGTFHLPVSPPESSRFLSGPFGSLLQLTSPATDFSMSGFGSAAAGMTERTFTFVSFISSSSSTPTADDVLLDYMSATSPASGGRVTYLKAQNQMRFAFTTTTGDEQLATVPVSSGFHYVAIVERLAGGATASVNIYVDSVTTARATLAFTSGTLITPANDRIGFASNTFTTVDELRLWPRDLSAITSGLCRLGFGGQPVGSTGCTLP